MIKKIVIGGCRTFTDYDVLREYLDSILINIREEFNLIIISGNCQGVDRMAEKYAKENGYGLELFPADWEKYGRSAGPRRNKEMVIRSDYVIAFWDYKSAGTKSLIQYAKLYNKPLRIKKI
ncbi:MAG: DUF2493 domain-containing protein [Ruminococcaceae bacterium]|nr:DUF2493 domain-containing protein [Oscillospiraceae bacterium]